MAASPHFARIKSEVLACVRAIPAGQVCEAGAIGDLLAVPARHVSYILATLDPLEADLAPWWRVVNREGALSKANAARLDDQIDRLRQEGVGVMGGRIADFASVRHVPARPDGALGRRPEGV